MQALYNNMKFQTHNYDYFHTFDNDRDLIGTSYNHLVVNLELI